MARKPDTPCAACGKLLYSGKSALPPGQRTCHECRRKRREEAAAARKPRQKRPPSLCEICGQQFIGKRTPDRNGLIQRTCSRMCGLELRRRNGWFTRNIGAATPLPWATCMTCRTTFLARTTGVCNTPTCRIRRQARRELKKRAAKTGISTWRIEYNESSYRAWPLFKARCDECHRDFWAQTSRQRYCCKEHGRRAAHRHRRHLERVAARAARARGERIFTTAEIGERDGWRCHICHRKVKPNDASMDHLVPLAHGGEHSLVNVALAHIDCNSQRSDRGPAQLRLVG